MMYAIFSVILEMKSSAEKVSGKMEECKIIKQLLRGQFLCRIGRRARWVEWKDCRATIGIQLGLYLRHL